MKARLTDLAIKKLPPPHAGQVTYWDALTPGFGIRCSARSKSYVVMSGQRRRLTTLGRYPELSLAEARRQARLLLASRIEPSFPEPEFDFDTVVEEYLSDCRRRLRASTLKAYQYYLSRIRFTGPISKIRSSEVMRAIFRLTDSPSSQNFAFATFKILFNWAMRRQYLAVNPLGTIGRPNRVTSRERTLSDDEVRVLLTHTLEERGRFNDIVSLLLLTGQRRSEIAKLEWGEVENDLLVLPANRTKNARAHQVPIGAIASKILNEVEGGVTFVFGTKESDQPFSGWSRSRNDNISRTGIAHFTLHDLRRTFATIHAKIGTPIHVTERLLNHVTGAISGVAAIYNRHNYTAEMRQAVDNFERHIESLLK